MVGYFSVVFVDHIKAFFFFPPLEGKKKRKKNNHKVRLSIRVG